MSLAAANPDGVDLDHAQLTELLAAYGIDLWPVYPVTSLKEAQILGEQLGWDVVLKASAGHLRDRPDMAHVFRNLNSAEEMRNAWENLTEMLVAPDSGNLVVQKNAPSGLPIAIRSIEDPLFGPVISFGISGPIIELLEDKSYRIPPLGERDVSSMIREVKSAPMLFGYRGAEMVDVDEVERLVSRVAQLQNDLPLVSSLELSLVLAGSDGASVLTASARVAPVADARSDLFVRRLPDQAGDTIPD